MVVPSALPLKLIYDFTWLWRNLAPRRKLSAYAIHVFCRLRGKVYYRVPREKLGECCGSMVLTAACYWPSSHRIPVQKFGSVSTELVTTVHRGCWTPTSVCCCHPRAYARGGFGVKPSPLSLIFYKILLPAQRRLIVFAYFLLVHLST